MGGGGQEPLLGKGGGYMGPVMPIFELVQEMMFVNTCVKFRDNRLRNEVCREVTPFQGQKPPIKGVTRPCSNSYKR